jgi:sugar lactone lactonase YvrE
LAQFNNPTAVAADASGNVYVADTDSQTIRKITPGGVVTTLAGLGYDSYYTKDGSYPAVGTTGSADGTGTAARFTYPEGVAVDGNGVVYVADTVNDTIRVVSPTGVVTTLAGSPGPSNQGGADGTGTAAQFYGPTGIAVAGNGNLYVTEIGNNTIRMVTPGGVVTTLAGTDRVTGSADGAGPSAQFGSPTGVALDANGNLYVTDSTNNTIRKVTPSGVVTTIAGTAGVAGSLDGTGSSAQFDSPWGIAIDASGNLYVSDSGDNLIRKITPGGVVTTIAGVTTSPEVLSTYGVMTNGTGTAAHFLNPTGMAVDPSGNVYVADSGNNEIRKISPQVVVTTLAGSWSLTAGDADGTGSLARFYEPGYVAVDGSGNLYVSDDLNATIRKITPAGVVTTVAGTPGIAGTTDGPGSTALFGLPTGVALDGTGNLYVADTGWGTIRKITPSGVVSTVAGTPGVTGSRDGTGSAAQFFGPVGLSVDQAGNVYISDENNYTIRKMTPGGVVTTFAGTAGMLGTADGMGSAAQFGLPQGLSIDVSGNIYVADAFNNSVRKITPERVVTTVAGIPGNPGEGFEDGPVANAAFRGIQDVAVDSNGNMFVTDLGNFAVRKITPGGVVTTVAGMSEATYGGSTAEDFVGVLGTSDGAGPEAEFDVPYGIAVDSGGAIYVVDEHNNTIRKGVPLPLITSQPQGATVSSGSTVVLTVVAPGAAKYQWEVYQNLQEVPLTDGTVGATTIAGSQGPQLVLSGVTSAAYGSYSYDCVITYDASTGPATVTTAPANLSVSNGSTPGSVTSLSARAFVGSGDNILIGGFYISGNTSATVLIQAIGPGLSAAPYNLEGTLQKPSLSVHQSQDGKDVTLYSNAGWGSSPVLLNAAAAAGAQPVLQPGAADSELLLTLPPGGYTAEVSGPDGETGVALCAVYQLP